MANVLSIISIIISVCTIYVTIILWKKERKDTWYWNIVLTPIHGIFKEMKSMDCENEYGIANKINQYDIMIKNSIDFLTIGVSKDKVNELKLFVERKFNKIVAIIDAEDSQQDLSMATSNFEIELFARIAKLT